MKTPRDMTFCVNVDQYHINVSYNYKPNWFFFGFFLSIYLAYVYITIRKWPYWHLTKKQFNGLFLSIYLAYVYITIRK